RVFFEVARTTVSDGLADVRGTDCLECSQLESQHSKAYGDCLHGRPRPTVAELIEVGPNDTHQCALDIVLFFERLAVKGLPVEQMPLEVGQGTRPDRFGQFRNEAAGVLNRVSYLRSVGFCCCCCGCHRTSLGVWARCP